jgi:hypothetical protein
VALFTCAATPAISELSFVAILMAVATSLESHSALRLACLVALVTGDILVTPFEGIASLAVIETRFCSYLPSSCVMAALAS